MITVAESDSDFTITINTHISPSWANYGVCFVRILEKNDHVITAPHCNKTMCVSCGLHFVCWSRPLEVGFHHAHSSKFYCNNPWKPCSGVRRFKAVFPVCQQVLTVMVDKFSTLLTPQICFVVIINKPTNKRIYIWNCIYIILHRTTLHLLLHKSCYISCIIACRVTISAVWRGKTTKCVTVWSEIP